MIISANTWRDNITWRVTVDLTTVPTVITITDDFGSYTVTGTQAGNRLTFSVVSRSYKFKVKLDTEAKVLSFDESDVIDGDGNVSQGQILAASSQDSTGRWIYLPICDTIAVTFDVYSTTGQKLTVQNTNRTPWWEVQAMSMRTILGVSYPCIGFRLCWSTDTRYLSAPATNTWADLKTIPFRVISTPIVKPNLDWRSAAFIREDFYGKSFYADYT